MQPTSDHTGHNPSVSDSPDLSKLSLGLSETSSDLSQKNNNKNKDISNEISPEILKKHSLITRKLQEIIDPNNLLLQKLQNKEMIKIYWGTATTGRPHLAYFLPLLKLKDFLDTKSCSIKILLADIHAMLDNLKSTAELIELRTVYYKKLLTVLLGILKVDVSVSATNSTSNIEFITGSSFQTSSAYVMDLYKLSTLTTERSAKKAGSEVVKQTTNTLLSSMLYPLMQALDEEYLKVDVQFGGIDQRKIFTYARGYLGRIGFKPRVHLMNPIIQSLTA
ncbi:putative tyrosine--tRNA ligase, cytoplasmic, partial [Cucumispora dikerogammari]